MLYNITISLYRTIGDSFNRIFQLSSIIELLNINIQILRIWLKNIIVPDRLKILIIFKTPLKSIRFRI